MAGLYMGSFIIKVLELCQYFLIESQKNLTNFSRLKSEIEWNLSPPHSSLSRCKTTRALSVVIDSLKPTKAKKMHAVIQFQISLVV